MSNAVCYAPWYNPATDEVTCCQCKRAVAGHIVDAGTGWRLVFVRHPSKQEFPLMICPRCSPDFPAFGIQ